MTPTNSSYIYRLPGPDGVCNTADDVFHMVKTGMSPARCADRRATGMPVATVRTRAGWHLGLRGQERREPGAGRRQLRQSDRARHVRGADRRGSRVAGRHDPGLSDSGQLYVVDGNIVYRRLRRDTRYPPRLFTIPNWRRPTPRRCLRPRRTRFISRSTRRPRAPHRHLPRSTRCRRTARRRPR